jgi:predicted PurR-regulated permease PerM
MAGEGALKKRPHEQSELIRVWTMVVLRVVLLLGLVALVIWVLYALGKVLLLLVLSIFFCYLIAPFVRVFEQPVYIAGRELRLPRSAAIGMVYALVALGLFALGQLVWPIIWDQGIELKKNLPTYLKSGKDWFNGADSWMRHLRLPPEWRQNLLSQIAPRTDSIAEWLQDLVFNKAPTYLFYLAWLIIVPILSFFMLKDAATFEQSLVALMPNERLRKRIHWLLLDVSKTIAAYVRAQVTACIEVGIVTSLALWLMGVPYALVLGLLSGILEFIPMLGPLTAAIICFSLSITVSFKLALLVAVFLFILRIVQDYIIYPRIVGHGIKLHPLVVIIALLSGAEIGGLSGIFLAIPFVGLMMVGYNHYLAYRGIQSLRDEVASEEIADKAEAAISPPQTPIPALEK